MVSPVWALTVPLSHMCDTAVLTAITVMSPGVGTKVVGINKHCQLTEGIYNLSMTVTHAPVGTIKQWPPVLLEINLPMLWPIP